MSKHIFTKPRVINAVNGLRRSVSSAFQLASSLPPLQKTLDGHAAPRLRPVFRALAQNVLSAAEAHGKLTLTFLGQDLEDELGHRPNFDSLVLVPRDRRNVKVRGRVTDLRPDRVAAEFDLEDSPPGEYQVAYETREGRWRFPSLSVTIQPAVGRKETKPGRGEAKVQLGGVLPHYFTLGPREDACFALLSVLSGEPDSFALTDAKGDELSGFEVHRVPPALVEKKAPHLADYVVDDEAVPKRIVLCLSRQKSEGQSDLRLSKPGDWVSARLWARCSRTGTHDSLEFLVPSPSAAAAAAP